MPFDEFYHLKIRYANKRVSLKMMIYKSSIEYTDVK